VREEHVVISNFCAYIYALVVVADEKEELHILECLEKYIKKLFIPVSLFGCLNPHAAVLPPIQGTGFI